MTQSDNKEKVPKKRFIDRYNTLLDKSKIYIILFWVALLVVGVIFGPSLFSSTEVFFEPPETSESMQAQLILETEFPNFANDTSLIILVKSIDNESVLTAEIQNFNYELNNTLYTYENDDLMKALLSYYFFDALHQEDTAKMFVSEDARTTMFVIMYNNLGEESEDAFIEYIKEEIAVNKPDETRFEVYLTGMAIIYDDMFESATEDLSRIDLIVIPIALVVLAIVLKRLRLMLIPILAIAISAFTSFAILYGLTFVLPIISFAPSIVMTLTIALAIDYALFLLTRYREELDKEKSPKEAINTMTEHAGHTILISGITLTICFLGLMFFPVTIIATLGISAGITVIITLLTNLTLTPALLLTFKKFFANNNFEKKISKKFLSKRKNKKSIPIPGRVTIEEKRKYELDKQNRSIWTKISKFSQKRAIPIIIIVGIVAVPVSLQVLDMDLSLDINLALPSQSEAVDSYQMLVESFPGGQLERHYIILETGEVNGLKNASFFSQSQELILNLTQRTLVGNESFTSISYASEMAIPWFMAVYWISNPEIDQNAMMYNQIWNEYTNEDNSTTILDIITPFDPYGSEEETWVEETRVILKDFEEKTGYKVHLAGKPVQQIDALNSVFNLFPIMIVTILVIVYIFIAIMFKSVFIPLRLILTIGLTMSWIFGLAVLVFEYDFFDWVAPEIMGNVSALYWLIPVLSFTIVLGLGLDYDIFLLSRISEYRKNAFTDKASIQKGVYKTGGIITAAGVIMAIAFSGLMISSLVVMKQLGFILCFAVLVDTFVIRTILVPAIMSIADKWNWWPAKLPIPTKDENFMDDDI